MIIALLIINKAGGLSYQKDFRKGPDVLNSNEYLVLAGTFHGIHAITSKLSPVERSSGIEMLETSDFKLFCFQTLTVCDLGQPQSDFIIKSIYLLYSDYVMKNPFYTPEMPIRCELFDINLIQLIENYTT